MGLTVANYVLQPFFSSDCEVPRVAAQLIAAILICMSRVVYANIPLDVLNAFLFSRYSGRPADVHQLLRRQVDDQNAESLYVHENLRPVRCHPDRCHLDGPWPYGEFRQCICQHRNRSGQTVDCVLFGHLFVCRMVSRTCGCEIITVVCTIH